MVLIGGYFSFRDNMPEMLALREPVPGSSDIAMTIGQIGLFFGITVSIILRIKFNSDYIRSFFGRQDFSPLFNAVLKFFCALFPLIIAIFVKKEIFQLISTFASLLCPYFIIIVPSNFIENLN
jgi:hypothetical protein